MQNINNNPSVKKILEGALLLIALVGAFYLGGNVTRLEFVDVGQTASVLDSVSNNKDPFAGYEYVLIDNSKGIHTVKTK